MSGYHPKADTTYIRLDMAIFWSHAFVRSCGSRVHLFISKRMYSNANTWQIDNCTLEDCLDQFTAPEWVANVKCSHCAHLEASQVLHTQLDISKMTTGRDQSLTVAIEVGHLSWSLHVYTIRITALEQEISCMKLFSEDLISMDLTGICNEELRVQALKICDRKGHCSGLGGYHAGKVCGENRCFFTLFPIRYAE